MIFLQSAHITDQSFCLEDTKWWLVFQCVLYCYYTGWNKGSQWKESLSSSSNARMKLASFSYGEKIGFIYDGLFKGNKRRVDLDYKEKPPSSQQEWRRERARERKSDQDMHYLYSCRLVCFPSRTSIDIYYLIYFCLLFWVQYIYGGTFHTWKSWTLCVAEEFQWALSRVFPWETVDCVYGV